MSWAEIIGVLGTFIVIMGVMTGLLNRSISTTRSDLRDHVRNSQKQLYIKLESVSSELKEIKGTLEKKVDVPFCIAVRAGCDKGSAQWRKESEEDRKELWDTIGTHSHSSLPKDDRVTRKG